MCFVQCQHCQYNPVWKVIPWIVLMLILLIHAFSAVCKVAEGHRMVSKEWTLFEHMCEEVGPGELPQLLRKLNSAMTPTPPATPVPSTPTAPVKTQPMEEEEAKQLVGMAGPEFGAAEFIEMTIMIKLGPQQYQFTCGNCDIAPKATKHAMEAHICGVQTKKALLSFFCHFSTYNLDSLQRHEKVHK